MHESHYLSPFAPALDKTEQWMHELMDEELKTDDAQMAYRALRSALHALRDQLPVDEAAQFAAQLPMLIRGVFYEGWNPSSTPNRIRDRELFLAHVAKELRTEHDADPTRVARCVFRLLQRHISAGEVRDVRQSLPESVQSLWFEDPGLAA